MLSLAERLSYLRTRYIGFTIGSILDVPILIVLWNLNYKIGFWVSLSLIILATLSFSKWAVKQEKILNLN